MEAPFIAAHFELLFVVIEIASIMRLHPRLAKDLCLYIYITVCILCNILYCLHREDQKAAIIKSSLKTVSVRASQDLKILNGLIHP